MKPTVSLVTVVSGQTYLDYASAMFLSACDHFKPSTRTNLLILPGHDGWPAATMMRYHVLAEEMPATDFVFLVDADMLFVATVGSEILPPADGGITATLHPGYVGKPRAELPYEHRPESAARVAPEEGGVYYCGGFVGGEREALAQLCVDVMQIIDADASAGLTPVWHDESAINRVLATHPPDVVLSPSYCYPDADGWYRRSVWTEGYERRLVAIDKSADERGER